MNFDDYALAHELTALRALRDACAAAGLLDEHGKLRVVLGTLPVTKDGRQFGMGANLWFAGEHTGNPIGVGVLSIEDADDRHEDDYEPGYRYTCHVRSTDGQEYFVACARLFSTCEAAGAAATPAIEAHEA